MATKIDECRSEASRAPAAQDRAAAKYTHSVWSGKKYDRPQTNAELIAESMAVLRRHPTIGKCLASNGPKK